MYDVLMRWSVDDPGTVVASKADEIEARLTAQRLSGAWDDTDEPAPMFSVEPALVAVS